MSDAKYYHNVASPLVEQLFTFRKTNKSKSVFTPPQTWTYVDSGIGEPTVLFISGMGTDAESHFVQIAPLQRDFRVLSVTVPGVPTMGEMIQGLISILDAEAIDKVVLFGMSFGGMVAQAFLEIHPERCSHLIVSHTMIPRTETASFFTRQANITRLMPAFLFNWFARWAAMKMLSDDVHDVTNDEKIFWQAYSHELYSEVITKHTFLGRMKASADYHSNFTLTPNGPTGWNGPVLVLESSIDSTVPEVDRLRLKAHYPKAIVHTISEYGHTGAMVRKDPYVGTVKAFLE